MILKGRFTKSIKKNQLLRDFFSCTLSSEKLPASISLQKSVLRKVIRKDTVANNVKHLVRFLNSLNAKGAII